MYFLEAIWYCHNTTQIPSVTAQLVLPFLAAWNCLFKLKAWRELWLHRNYSRYCAAWQCSVFLEIIEISCYWKQPQSDLLICSQVNLRNLEACDVCWASGGHGISPFPCIQVGGFGSFPFASYAVCAPTVTWVGFSTPSFFLFFFFELLIK